MEGPISLAPVLRPLVEKRTFDKTYSVAAVHTGEVCQTHVDNGVTGTQEVKVTASQLRNGVIHTERSRRKSKVTRAVRYRVVKVYSACSVCDRVLTRTYPITGARSKACSSCLYRAARPSKAAQLPL